VSSKRLGSALLAIEFCLLPSEIGLRPQRPDTNGIVVMAEICASIFPSAAFSKEPKCRALLHAGKLASLTCSIVQLQPDAAIDTGPARWCHMPIERGL
jgi:hypothetical protein